MSDTQEPNLPVSESPSAPPNDFPPHQLSRYEQRLSHWSDKRKPAIKRVWKGEGSPRNAVKFMCLECVGESTEAITDCGDRFCPLWHFRPFQTKTT